VLLVDGYNLLGQLAGYNSDDSEEEIHAVLAAAFADGPRLALQNRLCDYSHLRQVKVGSHKSTSQCGLANTASAALLPRRWVCGPIAVVKPTSQVVLVFDAIGSGSGTVIRTTAKGAIDVVYVGDADADTFIMLEVGGSKSAPRTAVHPDSPAAQQPRWCLQCNHDCPRD
jgi:predicted RNA-binding protein with PIN domain